MQDTKPNPSGQSGSHPVPAVGVVCWRGDEVLLIRRGQAPRQGEWTVPGGKVQRGERLEAAALRELFEETGVEAKISGLLAIYEIIEPEFHYILIDYGAEWLAGEPVAGDDADAARFMRLDVAMSLINNADMHDVLLKSAHARQNSGR
ncbi:NUDIX hydrolase [Asticcacaulis taihuensis]|uniref:8-oxo-dGTP diphosphatase n=1 Tax=Asticcacaulis taihuensis TaxID=260084 RepID=A0A1G4PS66_9CAUL|nr:8-oxo-dGTP diphosphatase [Asticcacaulis taihuensis]